ncbi:MAG: hypothetical protein HYR84_12940 [Planctomycetes bacterium]|nr:hypothetical protein [Planctomycetota bacterium]
MAFRERARDTDDSRRAFLTAVNVLHQHRGDWLMNKDEVARLLARMKKEHPILDKALKQLEGKDLATWARAVAELALVADRSVIATLRPALDDKRVWYRPDPRAAFSDHPPLLIRVCDTACESILCILDGKMPSLRLHSSKLKGDFAKQTEAELIAARALPMSMASLISGQVSFS